MSLLNVGAGPRTSGGFAGWLPGELHPLTASATATIRTRAVLIRPTLVRCVREYLPRVHQVMRIEGPLDGAHHVERLRAVFRFQELHLAEADAVLAGAGAVHRQRALD